MRDTISARAGLRALFVAAAACLAMPPSDAASKSKKLIPAVFNNNRMDALGGRWDFNIQTGAINQGTNYCFNGGFLLQINGANFTCNSPMMTPKQDEYVLSGIAQNSGARVTRRIRLDTSLGAARYLDQFDNPKNKPMKLSITIRTSLRRSVGATMTDSGTPGSVLGPKDCGLVFPPHQHYGGRYPTVLLLLCDPKAKNRPTVTVSGQQIQYSYSLTVPPKKTVSLLHGLGQRMVQPGQGAAAWGSVFKSFRARKWLRELPASMRATVYNGRGGGGGASLAALEDLQVERLADDVLAIGDVSRLRGRASCAKLSVRSTFGEKDVAFEQIAAIAGSKCEVMSPTVYLRDGQVVRGEIEATGLRFTLNSGISIELLGSKIDRLVASGRQNDGNADSKAVAWLRMVEGDQLLVAGGTGQISLSTVWGQMTVPVSAIRSFTADEVPSRGHRVKLRNGSSFTAFADDQAIDVDLLLFGKTRIEPSRIHSIVARSTSEDEEIPERPEQPYVVLRGDNVLVGGVELPNITLVCLGERIPMAPNTVRTLKKVSEGDNLADKLGLTFLAETWGNGTVQGLLPVPALPIRVGDQVWSCPVGDIVEVKVPNPTVPDSVRARISEAIADLGHAEWARREAAMTTLVDFGFLAKSQLQEATRATSDPEVSRRAQKLLDEMEK